MREYLYLEFKDLQLPFKFDFERLIDDFVFLCFFVGNDFLPHLPSLQIREGALDAIMAMYKNSLPSLDGYLTNQGRINFSNCDVLFKDIAKYEEEFFRLEQERFEREKRFGATYRGRSGRGGRGGTRNHTRFEGQNHGSENQQADAANKQPEEQKTEEILLEEAKYELQNQL